MKVSAFVHKPGPVSNSFMLLVQHSFKEWLEVEQTQDQKSAELVFLVDLGDIHTIYNESQLFCVLSVHRGNSPGFQPENVWVMNMHAMFNKEIMGLVKKLKKRNGR